MYADEINRVTFKRLTADFHRTFLFLTKNLHIYWLSCMCTIFIRKCKVNGGNLRNCDLFYRFHLRHDRSGCGEEGEHTVRTSKRHLLAAHHIMCPSLLFVVILFERQVTFCLCFCFLNNYNRTALYILGCQYVFDFWGNPIKCLHLVCGSSKKIFH